MHLSGYAKQAVLSTLGERDPARALALVQEDGGPQASWMADSFMGGWVSREPHAALKAFGELPTGDVRSRLVFNLASSYPLIDTEGALIWSRGLKNPVERQAAMQRVLEKMAISLSQ